MIKVDNLVKLFPNGFTALQGVSFQTPSCGLICITGESGCGKTTLLNCLYGAEDFQGKITVCGHELTNKNRDEFRKKYMTMIYQDYQLIDDMSIEDNLHIAAECVGLKLKDNEIVDILSKVGIKSECKKNKVITLSGGEKQRIGIARALVQKPRIILADEPTGNLDSRNSKEIFELLKSLSNDLLIIIVTHNNALSTQFGNGYIELCDGKIVSNDIKTDNISNANIDPASTARKTRLSKRTFLKMASWTGKSKILIVALSMFSVVLLAMSFIMSSFLVADEKNIEKRNMAYRPEYALSLDFAGAYAADDLNGIK